jgi:endonuclease YncB( thermonuclease family)
LVTGKQVGVEPFGRDQYDRVLGVLWADTVNVNVGMVLLGYAEVYRNAACLAYCAELDQAAAQAQQGRAGMWAQGAAYESPREYRRKYHLTGD